jgi:hypothetical protein
LETDGLVERTSRMFSLGEARDGDITSLQNWLDGTGCLAREERAYLAANHSELVSLAPVADNATLQLETWVEMRLARLCRRFRKGSGFLLRELTWTDRKSRTIPRKSRLIVMSSSTREA